MNGFPSLIQHASYAEGRGCVKNVAFAQTGHSFALSTRDPGRRRIDVVAHRGG
jgi:hypothetical protein